MATATKIKAVCPDGKTRTINWMGERPFVFLGKRRTYGTLNDALTVFTWDDGPPAPTPVPVVEVLDVEEPEHEEPPVIVEFVAGGNPMGVSNGRCWLSPKRYVEKESDVEQRVLDYYVIDRPSMGDTVRKLIVRQSQYRHTEPIVVPVGALLHTPDGALWRHTGDFVFERER